MAKLEDLHMLIRLLKEFEFPVSPILEYAIKAKEEELLSTDDAATCVEEPTNMSETISFTSIRDEFTHYLYKAKSEKTAKNYLRYIDKPIRKYINIIIDTNADSVYTYTTLEEVRSCISKLKDCEEFISDNLRWHHALTAALTCYVNFIESKNQ
jgi:hypothetical protein